jgi:hypothetical protein
VMTHAAVSLLRQLGLRNVYYTDDIFGTSHQKGSLSTLWNSANVSAFLHTFVFTTLGYFLSPKTIPIPSQQSLFLGLMVDSVQRRFTVPFHKMWKFLALVQAVFNDDGVTRRDLERIAGRAVSFSLAIPGALFFTRGMYRALTETRHQAASFMITASQLKLAESDLIAWLDLPIWVDTSVSSWPRQHHATIVMYSDASSGTEGRGATTSGVSFVVLNRLGEVHFTFQAVSQSGRRGCFRLNIATAISMSLKSWLGIIPSERLLIC